MVILGIDIGTTAVKAILIKGDSHAAIASSSVDTNAYVQGELPDYAEQSVEAILVAVYSAVEQLGGDRLALVSHIGLCGQMHGIVWWCASDVADYAQCVVSGTSTSTANAPWSRLITWEDKRCSPDFLDNCRLHTNTASQFSSSLATGYGIATFAHTLKTNPSILEPYDSCGTIQDLVAFILCHHSLTTQSTMDTTDACSWGGFNMELNTWNSQTIKALGIPLAMLPTVQPPGTIIGYTPNSSILHTIPCRVPVHVPMGDHPCSVIAALIQANYKDGDEMITVVNMGTSAQLAMVLTHDQVMALPSSPTTLPSSFEVRPFDKHRYLGVVACLSGGNMFAWLVNRCQQWMEELHEGSHLSTPLVYERLIKLGMQHRDTTLLMSPTLQGERSFPFDTGSLHNLQLHHASLGDLSAALCRGLIENLLRLIPTSTLKEQFYHGKVIATGNAMVRNPLLQYYLEMQVHNPTQCSIVQESNDAAIGIAIMIAMSN